jgi:dTDP-4-dehydrorhamnose reductase
MVFDGDRGGYREKDEPAPLSVYGRGKLQPEAAVLSAGRHLVVRLSLCFGPSLCGRPSYFDLQVQALQAHKPITCFYDEWRTPLSLRTAARALVQLLPSELVGLCHVGGPERLSRLDMTERLGRYLGVDTSVVVPASRNTSGGEPRPCDISLDSSLWRGMFGSLSWPGFEEALEELGVPGVK